ncbi:hypothetical protein [Bradyrhizobium sp. Arg816]|nr:hypothetical protein [Bradyrhizobium sp. Arg816]MDI3567176.1 hypothetical protein [Bradyrhizobium sp. Arg816]
MFVKPGHRITRDREKGESRGAGHEFVRVDRQCIAPGLLPDPE